eukprot:m.12655 g.12655  ORF g.12655 m.12655 type:complete len:75 (+) comp6970_c0_seq1:70-294(+)
MSHRVSKTLFTEEKEGSNWARKLSTLFDHEEQTAAFEKSLSDTVRADLRKLVAEVEADRWMYDKGSGAPGKARF